MRGRKKVAYSLPSDINFYIRAPATVQRYATCEASLASGPAYAIFNQFIGFLPPRGLSSLSLYFSTRLLGEQIDLKPTHRRHACTAFLLSRTRLFRHTRKKGRHAAKFLNGNSLRPAAEWHFSVCVRFQIFPYYPLLLAKGKLAGAQTWGVCDSNKTVSLMSEQFVDVAMYTKWIRKNSAQTKVKCWIGSRDARREGEVTSVY
jgi:hypothetical protein